MASNVSAQFNGVALGLQLLAFGMVIICVCASGNALRS